MWYRSQRRRSNHSRALALDSLLVIPLPESPYLCVHLNRSQRTVSTMRDVCQESWGQTDFCGRFQHAEVSHRCLYSRFRSPLKLSYCYGCVWAISTPPAATWASNLVTLYPTLRPTFPSYSNSGPATRFLSDRGQDKPYAQPPHLQQLGSNVSRKSYRQW